MRQRTTAIGLLILGLLLPAGIAGADEGALPKAESLRNASSGDWKAGRHDAAADKLARAAEIYRAAGDDYTGDLAICLRAMVWNFVRGDRLDDALETFAKLLELERAVPGVAAEVRQAYPAFYEAARAERDLEGAKVLLERVRKVAAQQEQPKVAAQVLHDLGSISRDAKNPLEAMKLLERAIAERDRIGDKVGKTWSLNNLANLYLQEKQLNSSLLPLLSAYRMVHDEQVVAPQAAVAINLRDALSQLDELNVIGPEHVRWLWNLADTGARSTAPEIVPSDYLLRRAVRTTQRLAKRKASFHAARRLMETEVYEQPPEVVANLTLFASGVAAEDGGEDAAVTWLGKVDVGKGPTAPHLEARLHTMRALAAAAAGERETFDGEAMRAAQAWPAVGDREGSERALELLTERAKAIGSPRVPQLEQTLTRVRSAPPPGGLGGLATGGGDRTDYGAIGLHEALFEIRYENGRMLVRDLVAEREVAVDVRWQPRSVSLNGLTLVFFGGWVKVESLDYGRGAAAAGQPGTTSLEALGEIRPVPGESNLYILKNGAVTYRHE